MQMLVASNNLQRKNGILFSIFCRGKTWRGRQFRLAPEFIFSRLVYFKQEDILSALQKCFKTEIRAFQIPAICQNPSSESQYPVFPDIGQASLGIVDNNHYCPSL